MQAEQTHEAFSGDHIQTYKYEMTPLNTVFHSSPPKTQLIIV